MVWVQAFPASGTNVSNVGQTQANWLFLQQTIGTDHYFNTMDNRNGHHQFVQTLGTGADSAVAAGMNGVLYNKLQGTANIPQMFWRENVGNTIRQVPTILTGTLAYPVIKIVASIINFVGLPFTSGLFTLYMVGFPTVSWQGFVIWENTAGGTLTVNEITSTGDVTVDVTNPSNLNFISQTYRQLPLEPFHHT